MRAAGRRKKRLGLPRRYTFKLAAPSRPKEEAMRRYCRMVVWLWNGLLQHCNDLYRDVARARYEWVWKEFAKPRKLRDGAIITGTYVRRHLAHADRQHSDPDAPKIERLKEVYEIVTHFGLNNKTIELAAACPEWRELSCWTRNRVAKALAGAFKGFWRGGGYPKYRSAQRAAWLPYIFYSGIKMRAAVLAGKRNEAGELTRGALSPDRWKVHLPGVGSLRAFGQFPAAPLKRTDADVRFYGGAWWLSVCVDLAPRREAGTECGEIEFNLVDNFAETKGAIPSPPAWGDILAMQDALDALKSERDRRYPRKPGQKPSRNWRRMTERMGKLSAHIARKRRERLHEWTTAVVAKSSDLIVVAPPAKDHTRSAKGTEKSWGAAVEAVAELNRHVLSQAPASAVQMLRYKAEEAGTRVDLREDANPPVAIGRGLSEATKAVRAARRALKKVA